MRSIQLLSAITVAASLQLGCGRSSGTRRADASGGLPPEPGLDGGTDVGSTPAATPEPGPDSGVDGSSTLAPTAEPGPDGGTDGGSTPAPTPEPGPDGGVDGGWMPAPACALPFDSGPCDGIMTVYAFVDGACVRRSYGGCGGNANRFATLDECMAACEGHLSSPLAEALVSSTWLSDSASGDCIELEGYMRFHLDGKAEHILIDSNACDPASRGTFITPYRYALAGRTLTMSSQLSWSRFDIAAGAIAGTRLLFVGVYVPVDAVAWRGASVSESYDETGVLLARNAITVDLRFAAPLPATGSGDCRVDVAFALDVYALKDAYGRDRPVDERSTSAQQAYPSVPCRYGPSVQGQQIDLEGPDLSSEPAWVENQVRSMFYSHLWLDPAEPSYLFKQGWWFARDALPDAGLPDAGADQGTPTIAPCWLLLPSAGNARDHAALR